VEVGGKIMEFLSNTVPVDFVPETKVSDDSDECSDESIESDEYDDDFLDFFGDSSSLVASHEIDDF
jgi:hypothetical protein